MNYDTVKYIIHKTNLNKLEIKNFRPSSTRAKIVVKQSRNNALYILENW